MRRVSGTLGVLTLFLFGKAAICQQLRTSREAHAWDELGRVESRLAEFPQNSARRVVDRWVSQGAFFFHFDDGSYAMVLPVGRESDLNLSSPPNDAPPVLIEDDAEDRMLSSQGDVANTVTYANIDHDAYTHSGYPSSNYGSSSSLSVGRFTGTTLSYVKASSFSISGTITTCWLELYLEGCGGTPSTGSLNANRILGSWSESTITASAQPSYDSGVLYSVPYSAGCISPGWIFWDVTAVAQGWKAGTYTNNGIVVKFPAGSAEDASFYFTSSESSSANKPDFYVEYTAAVANGLCYIDTACSAGNVYQVRDSGSGQCVASTSCTEIWKCSSGPTSRTCGGGTTDCVFSPGCGDDVQTCSSGFCTTISTCTDRIKTQGYAWTPTANQCNCADNPSAPECAKNTLTVSKLGTGSGTVTSSPAGINCGADCTEPYIPSTVVTLTAAPAAGSTFTGWSGACTGTGTCQVTMSAAKTATATFTLIPAGNGLCYIDTACSAGNVYQVRDSGSGQCVASTSCTEIWKCSSGPTSRTCGGGTTDCVFSPGCGDDVQTCSSGFCTTISTCTDRIKTQGYAWTPTANQCNCADNPSAPECAKNTLTVSKLGTGSGTVTSSPAGINCGADCTEPYIPSTVVTLTAAPAAGSTFTGWSGACTGTGTCQVTMSAAKTATATFEGIPQNCAATRILPLGYAPGQALQVTIQTAPPGTTQVHAVEDAPPAAWVVSNIDNGGQYDGANGKVKWGPFFDSQARVLHYSVTPPIGSTGDKSFAGSVSLDGLSQVVCGAAIVSPGMLHAADTNGNWRMEINEVTAYGAAWRTGATWPQPPNPIPIDYVTNAGLLWKSGETYHYDGSRTPPWIAGVAPSPAEGTVFAADAGPSEEQAVWAVGTATATLGASTYVSGVAFGVSIAVSPGAATQVYAVEDQAPSGWLVSAISDGGAFDTANGKVKWGPFFDNEVRTLTYTVTPPSGATGTQSFAGVASFDGASVGITGTRAVGPAGIGCSGPYNLVIPAAAHSNGQWQSDLDILNDGTGDAAVDVALLKQNQANTSPLVNSVAIPPGQVVRIIDILGTVLPATNAALGIRFCQGTPAVNSRFYNTATGGRGTYGMWVPGLPETAAVTAGMRGTFHLLTYSTTITTGFRVNIGLANALGSDATVVIRLYGDDGLQIGQEITKTLRAFEQVQYTKIHQVVSSPNVAHGWATVEVTTPGGKVHAYAMLIDNVSSDPIFMPVDLR